MSGQRQTLDPDFVEFLAQRLVEERSAATRRSAGSDEVGIVDELPEQAQTLDRTSLDQMSLDLLVLAYAHHDDLDPAWNRWLAA